MSRIETVDVVFDGPPSHESGRFVEVERLDGRSLRLGEWVERADGYWALRFPAVVDADEVRVTEPKWTEDQWLGMLAEVIACARDQQGDQSRLLVLLKDPYDREHAVQIVRRMASRVEVMTRLSESIAYTKSYPQEWQPIAQAAQKDCRSWLPQVAVLHAEAKAAFLECESTGLGLDEAVS